MTNTVEIAPKPPKINVIAYWVFTGILMLQTATGAVQALLHAPYFETILKHLGYPGYLATIIGLWNAAAFIAIAIPKFSRLKEWAYAGIIIQLISAAGSHFAVGDSAGKCFIPLIFAAITFVSWALRPASRKL